ncbi:MAG: glycosyltransferase family 2 protein, partial [Planctomycetota bacterium]
MTIGLAIPSLYPEKLLRVLRDIDKQTVKPDYILVVDNSCVFEELYKHKLPELSYQLEIKSYGHNIGPNAVWNLSLKLDYDYVGFLADDLEFEPFMLQKMVFVLENHNIIGCVVPTIIEFKPFPPQSKSQVWRPVLAKGNAGVTLMRKEVARKIPPIPGEYRLFFGDNWIGYWVSVQQLIWA